MNKTLNIEGIIYKTVKSTNNSITFCVLSNSGEIYTVLSKGSIKGYSKKNLFLELGNKVNLEIVEGYAVFVLKSIVLKKECGLGKASLEGFYYLSFICEVTSKVIFEGQEEILIYSLLEEIIFQTPKEIFLELNYFLVKLMQLLGHELHFSTDVIDQEKLQLKFSLPHGTLRKPLPTTLYKILKFLINTNSLVLVKKLKPSRAINKELFTLLVELFESVFQLKIKSALFLHQ